MQDIKFTTEEKVSKTESKVSPKIWFSSKNFWMFSSLILSLILIIVVASQYFISNQGSSTSSLVKINNQDIKWLDYYYSSPKNDFVYKFEYPEGSTILLRSESLSYGPSEDYAVYKLSLKYRDLDLSYDQIQGGIGGLPRASRELYQIIAGDYSKGIGRVSLPKNDSKSVGFRYFDFSDGGQSVGKFLGYGQFEVKYPEKESGFYDQIVNRIASSVSEQRPNDVIRYAKAYVDYEIGKAVGVNNDGSIYDIYVGDSKKNEAVNSVIISPKGEFLLIETSIPDSSSFSMTKRYAQLYDFNSKQVIKLTSGETIFPADGLAFGGLWLSDNEVLISDNLSDIESDNDKYYLINLKDLTKKEVSADEFTRLTR